MQETQLQARCCSLRQIADECGISEMSLRIKLSCAKKRGLELPPRRRVCKSFIYDKVEFMDWLWRNSDALRREFKMKGDATDE